MFQIFCVRFCFCLIAYHHAKCSVKLRYLVRELIIDLFYLSCIKDPRSIRKLAHSGQEAVSQRAFGSIPALPFLCNLSLGKLLNLTPLCFSFSHLSDSAKWLVCLLWGLNEIMHVDDLPQCWECNVLSAIMKTRCWYLSVHQWMNE